MSPTLRHDDGIAPLAADTGHPVVSGVTVDLQDAVEAGEEGFRMLPAAATGIMEHNAGRVLTAPSSIIAGKRPEIAGFCFASPRVQHRRCGFIHEELGGALQIRRQAIDHRGQMEGRLADPIRKRGAMQIYTRSGQDLGLSV